jgi:hypothetical protein
MPLANQNEEDTALVLSTNKEANKIILHPLVHIGHNNITTCQ